MGGAGHGLARCLAVMVATWPIFLAVVGDYVRCDPTPSLAKSLAGVESASCQGKAKTVLDGLLLFSCWHAAAPQRASLTQLLTELSDY